MLSLKVTNPNKGNNWCNFHVLFTTRLGIEPRPTACGAIIVPLGHSTQSYIRYPCVILWVTPFATEHAIQLYSMCFIMRFRNSNRPCKISTHVSLCRRGSPRGELLCSCEGCKKAQNNKQRLSVMGNCLKLT